jgi:secreted PhoX family phosphatase
MSSAPSPTRVRNLPVLDPPRSDSPALNDALQHCRWKCAYACFHEEAPARDDVATFNSILARALSRRAVLKSGLAASALVLTGGVRSALAGADPDARLAGEAPRLDARSDGLTFTPIALRPATEDAFVTSPGYDHGIVVRWGDPLLAGGPAFDPLAQSPSAQSMQFGYNCDYVSFHPRPAGANGAKRGILFVNHEYTNPELMFPGYSALSPTRQQVDIEIEAHGGSVVEIEELKAGGWRYVQGAAANRRITGTTLIELTGPAAGHPLLRTSEDPTGRWVKGMLNNCAGGVTPWGTVLTCEENFNQYFANRAAVTDPKLQEWHPEYGLPAGASERRWETHHDRFDLAKEPKEPLRFGWTVEIDPYDPSWTPRKRTALGRQKKEGATTTVAPGGRVVVYTGDDERFEYVYKFVSARRYRPNDRAHNRTLLDEGTLYVARFGEDSSADGLINGPGEWLPLIFGEGPLTAANGFNDQAEVLINARKAATLLGATPMDRPEDVERNPVTGVVYAVFTNNTSRTVPDSANPRPNNRDGHIIEIIEDRDDAAATTFRWQIFMLCGDPADPTTYFAGYDKSKVSPISSPDNIMFDRRGNLWIGSDGQPRSIARNDALFAVPVEGDDRGYLRAFLSVPIQAESTGPCFTPDYQTVFVAVQHPGEGSRFEAPSSRWPDYSTNPPRPSVAATWHTERGRPIVGS